MINRCDGYEGPLQRLLFMSIFAINCVAAGIVFCDDLLYSFHAGFSSVLPVRGHCLKDQGTEKVPKARHSAAEKPRNKNDFPEAVD